ncbi:MAG: HdeD family acid-resistance protein [Bacillota bacterium]
MSNVVSETTNTSVEQWNIPWWATLVQGLFSIIIGLLLITNPAATTLVIVQFIGIFWLVTGVFSIAGIFIDRSLWGWKLLSGAIGIFAGLTVIQHPIWSAILLPTMVVIIFGINGIILGLISFFGAFKGGGFSAAILGVIHFLFGVILLGSPLVAALALPWVFGFIALFGGIIAFFSSFQQRKKEEAV